MKSSVTWPANFVLVAELRIHGIRTVEEVSGMKYGNYCLIWPEFGVFTNGPMVKGFPEPGPVFFELP